MWRAAQVCWAMALKDVTPSGRHTSYVTRQLFNMPGPLVLASQPQMHAACAPLPRGARSVSFMAPIHWISHRFRQQQPQAPDAQAVNDGTDAVQLHSRASDVPNTYSGQTTRSPQATDEAGQASGATAASVSDVERAAPSTTTTSEQSVLPAESARPSETVVSARPAEASNVCLAREADELPQQEVSVAGQETLAASALPVQLPWQPDDTVLVSDVVMQAVMASDASALAAVSRELYLSRPPFYMIEWMHGTLGWPWWVAIAAIRLPAVTVTLPLLILQQKYQAGLVDRQKKMAEIQKLATEAMQTDSAEEAQRLQRAAQKMMQADTAQNGSIVKAQLKSMVPGLLIAVVFSSVYQAVSRPLATKAHTFQAGGALWFSDLTVPDPYMGLPLLCGLAMAVMTLRGTSEHAMYAVPQKTRILFRYGGLALSCVIVAFGTWTPAGQAVMILTSIVWGIGQGTLIRNDRFRALVGLPNVTELRARAQVMNQLAAENMQSGGAALVGTSAAVSNTASHVAEYNIDVATADLAKSLSKSKQGQQAALLHALPKQKKRRAKL